MRAAKRLQTIHVKDEQGRIVSSWQRVRVAVPDGISASLPPRGCRPNAKWGCARGPSAGGLDCTDWNRRSG